MALIVRVTSPRPTLELSPLLGTALGLDVWEVKPDQVVAQASEAQAERLEHLGYTVEQVEMTETYLSTFATDEEAAGYHSVETLELDLRALAEGQPEIVELHEVGRSVERRPIWALRIGERRGSTRKLLFTGCHHAREWLSVEVPYLLAEHLVGHANEQPVADWLGRGEIWVVPMTNPDGHEFSRTESRLWRKNRRQNPDGSFGVDPNRNYGYMWGTLNVSTSSQVPTDVTYVGPRAFSEPETRAIRDLIGRELISGVLSYHSYSQLILYPWGYTDSAIADPEDRDEITRLAERMQALIGDIHGRTYVAKQSSQLYPTAGDTTDWTYGAYDLPSLTIELRPRTAEEGGFVLPASQIEPTWEEQRPAAMEFIQTVLSAPEPAVDGGG
jgi:carboxypeptidase T